MRDWIKILGLGGIACLVLALLCILLVVVAPVLLGGTSAAAGGNSTSEAIKSLAPALAMLLIVLGALLFAACELVLLYEIVTAKNDAKWKLLWALLVIFVGGIGFLAYLFIGRKERR